MEIKTSKGLKRALKEAILEHVKDQESERALAELISSLSVTGWSVLRESATSLLKLKGTQRALHDRPTIRCALERASSALSLSAPLAQKISAQKTRQAQEELRLIEQLKALLLDLELHLSLNTSSYLSKLQSALWIAAAAWLINAVEEGSFSHLTSHLAQLSYTLSERLLLEPEGFFQSAPSIIAESLKSCELGGAHLEVTDERCLAVGGVFHDLRGVRRLTLRGWALAGLYEAEPPLGREGIEALNLIEPHLSCVSEEALLNLALTEHVWEIAAQLKQATAHRSLPLEGFVTLLTERSPHLERLQERAEAAQLIAERCFVYRRRHQVKGVSFQLLCCPSGEIRSPEVTMPAMWVMETPVTQALWEAVMGENPSHFKGDALPVEQVSWHESVVFANALSAELGLTPAFGGVPSRVELKTEANGLRIPFSAEWLWAASGGQPELYYAGSKKVLEVAWCTKQRIKNTQEVKQLAPNGYGLYDMSGNVWEWCLDDLLSPDIHSPTSSLRARRGGSWRSAFFRCQVHYMDGSPPSHKGRDIGLRLVMPLR
jgi:formylglycine-generating enzyme